MKDWTKTTFAERVHWARNRVTPTITQAKLAKHVKTSRITIANWEAGKHGAEGRNLELAAEGLDVDVIWLDTGEGQPGNFTPRNLDESLLRIPKLLIHYYDQADERGKDLILATAKREANRGETTKKEQAATEVPECYEYKTDDPELKAGEKNKQTLVVEVVKKKASKKKATKKNPVQEKLRLDQESGHKGKTTKKN